MRQSDTAELLAAAAAFDGRTVDLVDVEAWHAAIGDLDRADAMMAVIRHYRSSTEWLKPAHVFHLAAEIRRDRLRAEREARERQAIAAVEAAVTPDDRSDAVKALVAELRSKLPDTGPDIMTVGNGHWRRVREDRERMERAVPNPHYDPTALARLAQENNHGVQ